ncbi:MAG: hypothetical protein CMP10_03650 [Zetaproteobacteria bacterium]|nr:hypothetical protein [Pseudobdellovibrionaceae bacterium]
MNKTAFFLMLIIFWYLSGLCSLVYAASASSGDQTLQVSADGELKLPATIANITLGINISDSKATVVQKKLITKNNKLISFLKKQKVNELSTRNFQIKPKWSYVNNKKRRDGYIGTVELSMNLPVEKVGSLLDKVIANGADEIQDVQFTATKEEIEIARKKALKTAADNALKEGKHVLSSLGLSFKSIQEVIVGYRDMGTGQMPRLAFSREASRASFNIEAGNIAVKAQLTLILSYK